jgi:hypothetical protein
MPATATPSPSKPAGRRQRARSLVARLRHKQLLSALSGRVAESAVYAQRALRIRRAFCTCAG